MTFKPNDLVLCVDARGLLHAAHPTPREGKTYTVSCVETCCVTRVGLVEVPASYNMDNHCLACGATHLTSANFYAWRFVKVGDAMSDVEKLRAAQRAVDEATRVPARLLKPKRERETT